MNKLYTPVNPVFSNWSYPISLHNTKEINTKTIDLNQQLLNVLFGNEIQNSDFSYTGIEYENSSTVIESTNRVFTINYLTSTLLFDEDHGGAEADRQNQNEEDGNNSDDTKEDGKRKGTTTSTSPNGNVGGNDNNPENHSENNNE